jgi:hypothetical protein
MTVKLTVKLTPEELVELFEWHAKRLVESDEELEARASAGVAFGFISTRFGASSLLYAEPIVMSSMLSGVRIVWRIRR